MTPEIGRSFVPLKPVEAGPTFSSQNLEFNQNISKEDVKNLGYKAAGATLMTIGLYKVVTAGSVTDLLVGGVLIYAGYKVFTHKRNKD
jgi:hypothetical protein